MQWIKIGSQENHSQIHDQTLQSTINQTDDDDDADTCMPNYGIPNITNTFEFRLKKSSFLM